MLPLPLTVRFGSHLPPHPGIDFCADEAMKELVLPPLVEEPRILEDVINTWEVEGWRTLNKKERGPVFEAGGYPW